MRQLVIFAVYLNVEGLREIKSRTIIHETHAMLKHLIDENVQKETGTLVKWIILGVKNQETKIECIYPVMSGVSKETLDIIMKLKEKTTEIKL